MKTLHLSERSIEIDKPTFVKLMGIYYTASPNEVVRKLLLGRGYNRIQINWKGFKCKPISLYQKVVM